MFIKSATARFGAFALFLLAAPLLASGLNSGGAWSFFYAAEWALVLSAAILSPYVGFTGFFFITAAAGACTSLALLSAAGKFWFTNLTDSVQFGSTARLPGLSLNGSIFVDSLGYSFGLLTSIIGACVYLYAFSYMRFEKNVLNFLIFLQIFKLSMMLLVWAGNWATLILGWELIGASSFLLINYWTSKITTLKSAFKALSFNKVSDAALITAACISLWLGANSIQSVASFGAALSAKALYFAGGLISANDAFLFCVCVASFCKSAQLGFHFWLPDSMEAPVPASALIHSATLVSAGIYLTMRFSFCFLSAPELLAAFKVVTSATALYGAAIASFQTDVKKVLAYSTISHCGMLMYSVTVFDPFVTVFYLFAHGFFKSLNFLCVGNFIQYANNYQDVSRMGGFASNYGLEKFFLFVTAFNLSSAPLFAAFFSKHWLINKIESGSFIDCASSVLLMMAAFCGFFYSARLFYETLFSKKRSHRSTYAVKNVISADASYVKRANALGRAGMVALFFISLGVVCVLFLSAPSYGIGFGGVSAHTVTASVNAYQAFALLCFSLILFSVSLSYLAFKRPAFRGAAVAFALVASAALLALL